MTALKIYYIYESTTGCFGAPSTGKRLDRRFTDYGDVLRELKRLPAIKGVIRWIDFDWYEQLS